MVRLFVYLDISLFIAKLKIYNSNGSRHLIPNLLLIDKIPTPLVKKKQFDFIHTTSCKRQ